MAALVHSWRLAMGPEDLPRVRVTEGKPKRFRGKLSAPKLPRKDDHKRPRPGGGQQLTARAREFRWAFFEALRRSRGEKRPPIESLVRRLNTKTRYVAATDAIAFAPLIANGEWALHLTIYVPRQATSKLGAGAPFMDSDACLSPVKDTLEWARVIDNDMRIREDHTRTEYRARRPGLVIELRRLM